MSSAPGAPAMGTTEERWSESAVLHDAPRLALPVGRLVVISAHPDDEVLGAGGLLAELADLADRAPDPLFVLVTDGERSHSHSVEVDQDELARIRLAELTEALHTLGHQAPTVRRLRLPDSGTADHVDELHYQIQRSIRGADLVICPAANDGHVDHETVGRTTIAACAAQVAVWEMPIWTWHWTGPDDGAIDVSRLARLELSEQAERRKRRALQCFGSQVAPLAADPAGLTIVPPEMLAHFTRPYEAFLT